MFVKIIRDLVFTSLNRPTVPWPTNVEAANSGMSSRDCLLVPEVVQGLPNLFVPLELAIRAGSLERPVPEHDGLEDGGERGDADSSGDEDGVLSPEDVARGRAERTVHVDQGREKKITFSLFVRLDS